MQTYEEFRKDWLSRHKSSLVPRPRVSSWGLVGGLFLWALIAIGAALVSGAHSIPAILQTIPAVVPTPFREVLSLFGFTILELLVFAGALYRKDNRVAGWSLVVALIGALFANIGSSVHATGSNSGDVFSLAVAIILALIAPLAAFLAGEMVNQLYEKHHGQITTAMEVFTAANKDLDATINREYSRHIKQTDTGQQTPRLSERTDTRQTPDTGFHLLSDQTDRQTDTRQTGYGYNRTADGQQTVMDYLDANPDAFNLGSRELGRLIGVGHDTANKGRNAWKATRLNGHSQTAD